MGLKIQIKRKAFTLIEVLIALTLLGIILTEGLFMLSQQIKTSSIAKKNLNKLFSKKSTLLEIQKIFLHLYPKEKNCLISDGDKIDLYFDAGISLDPLISGFQKAYLEKQEQSLYLVFNNDNVRSSKKLIASDVTEFSIQFFSPASSWQSCWQSDQMGLPEMMHIKLVCKGFSIDQKFFLPFSLKTIKTVCKPSPSSFL